MTVPDETPVQEPEVEFFGTVDNVRVALSPELNDVTEDQQIERWLYKATRLIRARFTRFDQLVHDAKINLEDVANVCESAAERVARNPDGWRQFGIDNGNGTRDTVLSDGQVKILPNEWAQIYPAGAIAATQTAYGITLGTPQC